MLILLEFFVLLPTVLGSNDLLCSDSNLFVTVDNPSTFCQIQGLYVFRNGCMLLHVHMYVHMYACTYAKQSTL